MGTGTGTGTGMGLKGGTYREGEVRVVLEQNRHCAAQVHDLEGADVLPVDQDFALSYIVQA
jgi:hypothetical protein